MACAESSSCWVCGGAFTFFARRHHCRDCGRSVCPGAWTCPTLDLFRHSPLSTTISSRSVLADDHPQRQVCYDHSLRSVPLPHRGTDETPQRVCVAPHEGVIFLHAALLRSELSLQSRAACRKVTASPMARYATLARTGHGRRHSAHSSRRTCARIERRWRCCGGARAAAAPEVRRGAGPRAVLEKLSAVYAGPNVVCHAPFSAAILEHRPLRNDQFSTVFAKHHLDIQLVFGLPQAAAMRAAAAVAFSTTRATRRPPARAGAWPR